MTIMRKIQLNNKEVLESLNKYSSLIQESYHNGNMDKAFMLNSDRHTRDRWIADDYRDRIIQRFDQHEGYPESMRCYHGTAPSNGSDKMDRFKDSKVAYPIREAAVELNSEMMTSLSAKRNALCATYPPGGWISWHNNANASGYNILFTWSENGNGWFRYYDLEKKENVTIYDKPGWQCKMGYFGPYDNPDSLCYHCASTEDLRITVAYMFIEADNFWEEVVYDIENG